MHALFVLYPQPDDPEAFRDYYEAKHVPLAASLPGLVAQSYAFPAALGPDPSPWFCIWRGEFESAAALEAALGSPVGEQVAADVPNYSPRGATLLHAEIKG